ncbi:MAG: C40 family peptidase [Candidatus Cryptobacteroides sp.]
MRHNMYLLAFAAGFLLCGTVSGQEKRYAVTDFSVNYMRLHPDYESPLETQELMGTVVEIVSEDGYWKEIVSPQPYKAWATDMGLAEMDKEQIREYLSSPRYVCTGITGRIRTKPDAKSDPVCDYVAGDIVRAATRASADGKREEEMSRKEYITIKGWAEVILPSGKHGFIPSKDVQPLEAWCKRTDPSVENILRTARQFIGTPYLWGGMSPKGFDCSGLVRYVWFLNGVLLPRNASQQIRCGERVKMEADHSQRSREEMLRRTENLHPGDLVFFGKPATKDHGEKVTHVGIYIGDHKIIHSSHMVRINSLLPGDSDHYINSYKLIGACRITEGDTTGTTRTIDSPAYFLKCTE